MNKKNIIFCASMSVLFCANVSAMQSLPLKASRLRMATPGAAGILFGVAACAKREAHRATTEASQLGRAALLATVRVNQGVELRSIPLSKGFTNASYNPKVRNKTVGWLKEALPRMRENVVVDNKTGIGLQMMTDWLQERDELAKRYDELQKAEQGSANVEELNTVTRRLKDGDEKLDELLHELSWSESRLRELDSQAGKLATSLMIGGCELLLNTVYYGGVFMVGLFILGSLRR